MSSEEVEIHDDAAPGGDRPQAEASLEASESVSDLQAKIESLQESLLRAKADFQNLQRRSAVERSEAVRYANAELMKSLLGVLDDFERALSVAQGAEHNDTVLEGIRLTYANLIKALADFGLEPIDALGQTFDPAIHQALLHQPTDQAPPGSVIEQAARGYRLRDRVLRPARVVVAKAPEA